MIGVPPGGTIGVKPAQIRDKPKRKPTSPRPDRRDEELRRCIEGWEADKIAWAEQMADAPLMGRDERTGRFVSLKGRAE